MTDDNDLSKLTEFLQELKMKNPLVDAVIGNTSYVFAKTTSAKPSFKPRVTEGETVYLYTMDNRLRRLNVWSVHPGEFTGMGVRFDGYVYEFVEENIPHYYDIGQTCPIARTPEEARDIHVDSLDRNIASCTINVDVFTSMKRESILAREKVVNDFEKIAEEFKAEDEQDINSLEDFFKFTEENGIDVEIRLKARTDNQKGVIKVSIK